MSYPTGTDATRRGNANAPRLDLDIDDWDGNEKRPRDLKKMFLVGGLGILSWVATYVGMLELIEANMGDLPLVHKAIIGFSVAMLMTMIIWLLDQLFAPIGTFTKLIYAAGYVFLSVISVGFGFGFYWKVLESRWESSRSAEGAVGQVQTSLFAASTRLEQLQGTLESLTTLSTQKAQVERASGTSCPNSKPGDGPRRKLRDDDAARFTFASEFVKGRVANVKGEMGSLNADLAKITSDDKSIIDVKSGTRNEFMKGLSRKLDMTVTGFNAFRSDPQLKQIRNDLNERADRATFPDTKGATFSCPDPQLATALKGVVRAIDELPIVEKPKIAAVEGSEATIEAFRRLTATFYGALSFKLPPSADELRDMQKKAVQSVEGGSASQVRALNSEAAGLSKRDYVPLAVALFVDICLLLVSMGRPMNRLGNLMPKMRAAERGPVSQILSRFNDIHRDPEIRRNFEVFRHVVFDFHGDYYVAVPLDAPFGVGQRQVKSKNGRPEYFSQSPTDVSDAQVEAHILANLFTSFEKEKIFSRVYSPFLTTRTIQKRLARQGSKFAHARAFRVYRFKDGAWSEIILGAVMGVARRVEAQKRAQNLAEGLRLPEGGDLGATLSANIPTTAGSRAAEQAAQGAAQQQPTVADHAARYRSAMAGGRAQRSQTSQSYGRAAPAQGWAATGTDGIEDEDDAFDYVAHAAKYGPYASHVAPDSTGGPQAQHRGHASAGAGHFNGHANNNTAPHAPAQGQHQTANGRRPDEASVLTVHPRTRFDLGTPPSADVIAMPGTEQVTTLIPDVRQPEANRAGSFERGQVAEAYPAAAPAEDTVTYELKRETATVTVPVSKAADTQSMFEALKARAAELQASTRTAEHPAIAGAVTPPPLPTIAAAELTADPSAETARADEVIILGSEPDSWSESDAAVLKRFGARPAG